MRPLVKPLVAVVALSLATTSAYAAMGAKTKSASKASSCGPVLDTKMDRVMNVNSPSREVLSCWADRFALGGEATLAYVTGDQYDDGLHEDSFNIRNISLITDVKIAKNMNFHLNLETAVEYENGTPQPGNEIVDTMGVSEAYLTIADFAKSPVYLKAGKSYSSFGNYDEPFPVVYSLNQALTQSQMTSVNAGFASNAGYDMQFFVFENESDARWDEYGFRLGYAGEVMGAMKDMGFKFNLSYVSNAAALNGVNDASHTTTSFTNDVAAYNTEIGFKIRNFDIGLEYFTTDGDVQGSLEPEVTSFKAAYNMLMGDKKADLHIGFEKAKDADGVTTSNTSIIGGISSGSDYATSIPEKHINLGMNYMLDKNAKFSLNYDKFEPYATQNNLSNQEQFSAALKVSF